LKLSGKVVVITGAASGIGEAVARRFAAEGVAGLVLGDIQQAPLEALAAEINASRGAPIALAIRSDVTTEAGVQALAAAAEQHFGRTDVFFSNAGLIRDGHEETPDADWMLNWNIHVMAHVWAARAVLPGMIARGSGYLLSTSSAAGLLTSLPSASYAASKHAAIAFAENMAIRHAGKGIRVSVVCPQSVDTPLIRARASGEKGAARVDGVISAEALADCVVAGVDAERFLILPHPSVLTYFQRKAADYDRWLAGMRRFEERLRST
jgi:NAD(P)-dependent dehydrogenase (short-subunit alcohol dehydrogenase family)